MAGVKALGDHRVSRHHQPMTDFDASVKNSGDRLAKLAGWAFKDCVICFLSKQICVWGGK